MDPLGRLRWVFEAPENCGLPPNYKLVLAYVAWRDGEGGCSASAETISEETGVSVRSVRRAFVRLGDRLATETSPGKTTVRRVRATPASGIPTPASGIGRPLPVAPLPVASEHEDEQEEEHEDEPDAPHPPVKSRTKKNREPTGKWLRIWNEIAGGVEGVAKARVFSASSEKSLLDRAAALGLDPRSLEAALRERIPLLSPKAKGWVRLSWLAEGKRGGLQSLLNGDYEGTNGYHNNGHDDDTPIVLTCEGELRHARR